ncbi:MAG: hypothetical protein KatS3mg070_2200 [Meiothermus sp.]|uniref:DUF499 domain-containing protein n=1 Tax=Meiothermus sp. TaxID=1955249 RepID=UPI0021DF212A|nr:DUF499 domain-containing protein [Meiothermus sp.]GIW28837.1 MAG: hypothetical protein KatS3mg070_2200 [Meiothermus sp.]
MKAYNHLGQALKLYADALKPFFLQALKQAHGEGRGWVEAYLGSLSENRRGLVLEEMKRGKTAEETLDLNHFKDILLGQREVFRGVLGRNYNRAVTWADEISEVRNDWAHQKELLEDDVNRALDSMARLLRIIGAEETAQQVRKLMARELPKAPQGSLPPWWQLAEPDEVIRRGDFDENTFAAKLDDVVAGRAPAEYRHAELFFKKTYLTQELATILKDTLRRLSGLGGEAVTQLRTPFGGGKTHTLIALYHLVKAYSELLDLPEVQSLLQEAGLRDMPKARVAVLVGTELSAQGRKIEGLHLHTLWGELAYQLGGRNGYEKLQAADENRSPPGKQALRELLEAYSPVLILIDELLVYQVKAASVALGHTNLQAQTFAFLQELSEVVGGLPNAALITTFPESHLEYYDHQEAPQVFARLEKIFGRVQAVRMPVQGEEIFEVLRRRLFERIDGEAAKHVVAAYMKTYDAYRNELPSEVRSGEYGRKMLKAFPFHPTLVEVLYERWGTLQTFQKTRGVLRLLARVVETDYLSPTARPLIGLGDATLGDADLRATITSVLGEANWESVLASDIVPPEGKAHLLDRELGGEYARHRLGQSLATAIFMYSHSGGAQQGATRPQLNLALAYPEGITPLLVGDALDNLKGRLYYLYANGSWSFKAQPNLNAVLADRMAQVKAEALETLLQSQVEKVAGSGPFKVFVWPQSHREVPDSSQLKLVLLGPEAPHDDEEALKRLYHIIQDNHASGPRINKNTTLYLALAKTPYLRAQEAARKLLALEDIQSDRGLVLSEEQKAELTRLLKEAREALPVLLKSSYTGMLEPQDAKGSYRFFDLTAYARTQPTLQAAVTEVLRAEELLLNKLDPAYLVHGPWGLWPQDEPYLNLRELREYFLRLPQLPFLEQDEVLKNAILQGIRIHLFELGVKGNDGFTQVWDASRPPGTEQVFFGEAYVLARPGKLPRPGSEPGHSTDTNENEDLDQDEPVSPPNNGSDKKTVKTKVRVTLEQLELSRIPTLVDLAKSLRDAGGTVQLRVEIEATSPKGLDEGVLNTSAKEILDQHGLKYEWHEE